MLDRLFAFASMMVRMGEPVVLQGVSFPQGRISDAIIFGVKLSSYHPEVLCVPGSDVWFNTQCWIAELQSAANGEPLPYPGAWFDLTFKPIDGSVGDVSKQFTRALVADHLDRRIRECPDLVELDQQRRPRRRRRPTTAARS
jgi:hypothetical protein